MGYKTNAELEKEVAKAHKDLLNYKTNKVWATCLAVCIALSFTALCAAWTLNTRSDNARVVEVTQIQAHK